jgi:hypothetical protein
MRSEHSRHTRRHIARSFSFRDDGTPTSLNHYPVMQKQIEPHPVQTADSPTRRQPAASVGIVRSVAHRGHNEGRESVPDRFD